MIIDAQNAIKELYPYVPSQMGISVSQVMKGMSSYTEWDKIQLDEQNTLLEYYGASELFSVRFFFENGKLTTIQGSEGGMVPQEVSLRIRKQTESEIKSNKYKNPYKRYNEISKKYDEYYLYELSPSVILCFLNAPTPGSEIWYYVRIIDTKQTNDIIAKCTH